MSRIKISEYAAKRMILGEAYQGLSVVHGNEKLPKGKCVVKVDQGIKKRMKQGLVAIDVSATEVKKYIAAWRKKGYSRFLVEPMLPHSTHDEQYLSLERVRDGVRVLFAREGGIEIESHPEKVYARTIVLNEDIHDISKETGLPEAFLSHIVSLFEREFIAFLEINPLVVQKGECVPLDAAVLVDSAGEHFARGWNSDDIIEERSKHPAEDSVRELAATTPASLKLTVLNPHGSIFLLLSGGGGSIVIADEAALKGAGDEIGNYGEYSGGPTREETYLYAKEVIGLLLDSKKKQKALVIAGGVANFTDVQKTFAGIIDALGERAEELRKHHVKVFVRRGGPNERAGLALMRTFLEKEGLLGSVHGSDAVITSAIEDAIIYIRA